MANTLIFATVHDVQYVFCTFGGMVAVSIDDLPAVQEYLYNNTEGVVICVGDWALAGWEAVNNPHVMFTATFPKDPDVREQARARSRPQLQATPTEDDQP